jgi:hypothetical protein
VGERYFLDRSGVRVVGAGVRPEAVGIDTRSVLEVPRPAYPGERWVGPRRGWVVSKVALAAIEEAWLQHRRSDPAYVAALEERLAKLEAAAAGGS